MINYTDPTSQEYEEARRARRDAEIEAEYDDFMDSLEGEEEIEESETTRQITPTSPDFTKKISGLVEDYQEGNIYAIDQIMAIYEEMGGEEITEQEMLEALDLE